MARIKTDYIVVHCADTYADMDIGFTEIDRWHRQRGFNMCGYHGIIRRDGKFESGRELSAQGAHVKGYNHRSVGICMVGGKARAGGGTEDNFTVEQYVTLRRTLANWIRVYPHASVVGHNDLAARGCPSFDVGKWMNTQPELLRMMDEPSNQTQPIGDDDAADMARGLEEAGYLVKKQHIGEVANYIRNRWTPVPH